MTGLYATANRDERDKGLVVLRLESPPGLLESSIKYSSDQIRHITEPQTELSIAIPNLLLGVMRKLTKMYYYYCHHYYLYYVFIYLQVYTPLIRSLGSIHCFIYIINKI